MEDLYKHIIRTIGWILMIAAWCTAIESGEMGIAMSVQLAAIVIASAILIK